ncbi:hypothetical protein EDC18_10566 [Natranaerovirga pectinivora]|uniref:Uncharacterized protein n=1 Tax=Natranaerovirga pectinivora TaxID=682400 RepID=A0A4R3MJY8_9FIRM|nr:hypothetical protein [Natranaerovirga pectinivora]TCT14585.1 hypothetical protein EDC18_10566 [Natranaerovirga pectinivora]
MKIPIEFKIDVDVLEKFNLALILNKGNQDEEIEKFMMQYISSSFSKASQVYKPVAASNVTGTNDPINANSGKAIIKIPKWATKSEQYNHKIIRAFFQVESELAEVPLKELESRCSDSEKYPSTYVRDFKGNFNQMKIDTPKSNGKVFEVKNGNVIIWDYVKEILMEYKRYFS